MAQPTVRYIVLPEKVRTGQQYVLTPYNDIEDAKREAVRQCAATGDQYIVFTSSYYTDKFEEWLQSTIDEIAKPYVDIP